MLSWVASVEFQLKVADSPLLMEAGLACSVTVGRAATGAGGGGGGGAATFFFAQPKVKPAATLPQAWPISAACPRGSIRNRGGGRQEPNWGARCGPGRGSTRGAAGWRRP